MQSSTVVLARTLIMLACTIVVPLLAIFGTAWLPLGGMFGIEGGSRTPAKTAAPAYASREPANNAPHENSTPSVPWSGESPTASPSLVEARPAGPNDSLNAVPPSTGSMAVTLKPDNSSPFPTEMAAGNSAPGGAYAAPAGGYPPSATNYAPAGAALPNNSPAVAAAPDSPRIGTRGIPTRRSGAASRAAPVAAVPFPSQMAMPATNTIPAEISPAINNYSAGQPSSTPGDTSLASFQNSGETPTATTAQNNEALAPPPPATLDTQWFGLAQQQLRQMGATYYVLETWEQNGTIYRFHCKMADRAAPDGWHPFEATDSDPTRAVQRVLDEIATWQQRQS